MSLKAVITNISRGSLHDGPGLRSVVYFKGCGLRCAWCHNPETFFGTPMILYASSKCIHCGRCISVCPDCHQIVGKDMVYHREGCTSCGQCVDTCPSGALSLCGKSMSAEEIMKVIRRDKHYYTESGGGVTLSGGECLLQSELCEELLKSCRAEQIGTAVESALFVPWEAVERVYPFADIIFADMKLPDGERHRQYTGQDNNLILENLQRLSGVHHHVILRIPLIPGVNDSLADMKAFADIISTLGAGIQGIELLKYNYLAESKYALAGMDYQSFGKETQGEETLQNLVTTLKSSLSRQVPVYYRK